MSTNPNNPNWREFISWKFWLHTAIVDIILTGIWFGVNKLAAIIPLVRDIGFLVLIIAGMFCVAWYLPRLSFQFGNRNSATAKLSLRKPIRIEHDNVLWEDRGSTHWDNVIVVGPLCPKDFTPLSTEHRDKIEPNVRHNTFISDYAGHSRLFCTECKSKYTFGSEPKSIEQSKEEVRNRFEGKRRRESEI